jgi:DNA-binding CsgD family transcriptional regulator
MQDKFDADLWAAFEVAKKYQGGLQLFKKLSREDPEGTARRITDYISKMMEVLRKQTAQEWKVDIADLDGLKDALGSRDLLQLISLFSRADLYHAYGELLRRIAEYASDTSLSREKLAKKVCKVGEEAFEVEEASKLHMLHLFSDFAKSYGTEEAARRIPGLLGQQLAGHLATRTSTSGKINLRLAYALDELRERKKPQSRERLEVLLREVCVLAPEVWDKNHRTDLRLRATRSAVVKKIEKRLLGRAVSPPPTEETDLAAFANKELLRKRARAARLSPQESEVFELLIENPKLKYREIADRLGISTIQVGVIKHRIKSKLAAGF